MTSHENAQYHKVEKFRLVLLYRWKIWRGIQFGGLAVYLYDRQIKIRQYYMLEYNYMYGDPLLNRQIKIHQYFCNGDLGPNCQI